MAALTYLDLSVNGLKGSIPQSFGNMTSLSYLDLSENESEGSINPLSFGNMTALEYLDLSTNQLEGEIPKSIWKACTLRELRAYDNNLSGELHLAESSSRCAHFPLERLDLGNNQIIGSLPNFTVYPSLKTLRLGSNKLDGVVSKFAFPLSKLEILDISENSVSGVISEAHFSKLANLRVLDLSSNSELVFEIRPDWIPPFQLEEINLGSLNLGPQFPKWLRTQKSYTVLHISNSRISSSVPDWLWNNINSRGLNLSNDNTNYSVGGALDIDLSSNQLEGPIPLFELQIHFLYLFNNSFSRINSQCNVTQFVPLRYLDISNNQLSGELPDCWSSAEGLEILNLANNNFVGKIPISIGFLTSIDTLHLSNNHLTGKLPSSLINCTLLKIFDVGENKLLGPIPEWTGRSLTNLVVLSLRSNNFQGSIPSRLCHLQSLQLLDLSSNNLSSSIPTCLGNITAMKRISSSPNIGPQLPYMGENDPGKAFGNQKLRLVWKGLVNDLKNLV
ncbi:hypothetical protein TIFTF001_038691 [Ficus carica]|uniref:Uncharacterized protein n=1 Tax=Ficus carica TaxID=3494 RepID=A0AA88EBY5_FICCA|nr:hypothetical protein TIFTF001_038691 [Ficus carica]